MTPATLDSIEAVLNAVQRLLDEARRALERERASSSRPPVPPPQPNPTATILTVSEAADALQIGRSTLYRLFNSGDLRWVQVGSRRRVTAAEVHRYIAVQTSTTTTS